MTDLNTVSNRINSAPRMRGRQLFYLVKPLLCAYSSLLKLLPNLVIKWLLIRFRYIRGYTGLGLRYGLIHRLAKSCGDNLSVADSVFLRYIPRLALGNHVSIHPLCYIDAQGGISIGNDVSIAHNVSILSFEHDFSDTAKLIKDAPCIPKEIIIEDDVWIGAGAKILGGVKIGTGSVIGAGAVVTKDIAPLSVAVGVPARVIKSRKTETIT